MLNNTNAHEESLHLRHSPLHLLLTTATESDIMNGESRRLQQEEDDDLSEADHQGWLEMAAARRASDRSQHHAAPSLPHFGEATFHPAPPNAPPQLTLGQDEAHMLMLAPYGNITNHTTKSRKDKESNALTHFKYYLIHHRNYNTDVEDIQFDSVNDDLIGGFMEYLAKDAHKYCNPAKDLLAFESATGYASSVKAYFCEKFKHQGYIVSPRVFQEDSWRPMRRQLQSVFRDRNRLTGEKMSNPRPHSTDQDRDTVALVCVWKGDATSSEFWALGNTMYAGAGRGSEVASARKVHFTIIQSQERYLSYPRCNLWVQRSKNGVSQDLAMYIHRVRTAPVRS